ncbi:SLOG family protein [Streptomyces sp. NPDC002623]
MPVALIGLTGSRLWPYPQLLEDTLLTVLHEALEIGYNNAQLMHGCAEGVDTIGHEWAWRTGLLIREFPADWNGPCAPECPPGHRRRNRRGSEYCPLAGHRRNQRMVDERPVLFVAASYRNSSGTADCLRRARAAGIPDWTITAD